MREIIPFRFREGRVLGLFRVDTVIEDIVKVSFYCFSSILTRNAVKEPPKHFIFTAK